MRRPGSFARRFIAGETSASDRGRAPRSRAGPDGHARSPRRKRGVAREAAARHARVHRHGRRDRTAGVSRNISLKLTQLGLDVDRATCIDNLRRVLDARAKRLLRAHRHGELALHRRTLDTFETLWSIGYRNVGVGDAVVSQRSARDLDRLNALGGRVRLVKGAYREPRDVAFQQKTEVDAAFVELMQVLLSTGTYPAIATHDPAMIDATQAFAAPQKIAKDRFEFQMLYGIRRDLQAVARARRLSVPRLRPVRQGVVSVFHAPARRTARQRGVCRQILLREKS